MGRSLQSAVARPSLPTGAERTWAISLCYNRATRRSITSDVDRRYAGERRTTGRAQPECSFLPPRHAALCTGRAVYLITQITSNGTCGMWAGTCSPPRPLPPGTRQPRTSSLPCARSHFVVHLFYFLPHLNNCLHLPSRALGSKVPGLPHTPLVCCPFVSENVRWMSAGCPLDVRWTHPRSRPAAPPQPMNSDFGAPWTPSRSAYMFFGGQRLVARGAARRMRAERRSSRPA
jgi:hypothetical protein